MTITEREAIRAENILTDLARCGTPALLKCPECFYEKPVVLHCQHRMCEKCREFRYIRLLSELRPILDVLRLSHIIYHLTLTCKTSEGRIPVIRKDFSKRLRKCIRGTPGAYQGIYFFEALPRGEFLYHAHLHVLVAVHHAGNARRFQNLWNKACGYVTNEKPRRVNRVTLSHLVWYATKGDVRDIDQYIAYGRGVRLVSAFGDLYGIRHEKSKPHYEYCPNCGLLMRLHVMHIAKKTIKSIVGTYKDLRDYH